VSENIPGLASRIGLAIAAFFRLLLDGAYASQLQKLNAGQLTALPEARGAKPEVAKVKPDQPAPDVSPKTKPIRDLGPALQLLELLQREGRFIDFLQQDIVSFSDSDVGAAARIVHQGCKRALDQISTIETIRNEPEGGTLTLDAGFDAKAHRLVGNVQGGAPYRGTLKHRGWRVTKVTLEEPLPGATLEVVAQAEIEL